MTWNRPSNNGHDQEDPWDKRSSDSKHINKKKNKSYLFLEIEYILNFLNKYKKFFVDNFKYFKYIKNPVIIIMIILIVFIISSGFYIIKESERGVVTCFGKYSKIVNPGLNWKMFLINQVIPINVETIRELVISDTMLTSDENIIQVQLGMQYRIVDPKKYLFSVVNPDDSLRQATNSVLRSVVGHFNMNYILTQGRIIFKKDIQKEIDKIIRLYNLGIVILDVNIQKICLPKDVQVAFDDVVFSRENKREYIKKAKLYVNEIKQKANRKAQRILEEAKSYKLNIILEAQGESVRFSKMLPAYRNSKAVTINRLYIEFMEKVLSHVKKIFINSTDKKLLSISLNNYLLKKDVNLKLPYSFVDNFQKNIVLNKTCVNNTKGNDLINSKNSLKKLLNERKIHDFRTNYLRTGRE